ncbi:flagellar biosynthesis protein FlhF [Alicyclobacillus sp.]|uniref:flagellar biosynthesis protein FlhF n=1 Tax=Alicyclobacillus sp. TaxID=61169 RepID=UPI0025C2C26D|nr:flagellar biosynthesis protein FlhF [Alicyclobacillus sp.]MCL6515620.1 flagellar biosynthesis protein FlhF [Alicyclobacillus sp.]
MIVRRYVVREMPEAVALIRKELGKDAVILSTKKIKQRKWLGLWRSTRIEVMAATGDDVPLVADSARPRTGVRPAASAVRPREARGSEAEEAAALAAATGALAAAPGTVAAATEAPGCAPMPGSRGLLSPPVTVPPPNEGAGTEPAVTSDALESVRQELAEVRRLIEAAVQAGELGMRGLLQTLVRQGVQPEQVWPLLDSPGAWPTEEKNVYNPSLPARAEQLKTALTRRIVDSLADLRQPQPIAPDARVVVLVGPTGVGKTTTIAKLAALHVIAGDRRVGLVTTDTYRIAAVDQLRTYATILNVPLEVVEQPADFPAALERLSDRDLILVDTAGRNFRMDVYVDEVRALLAAAPVDEVHLVLSLTAKPEDMDVVAGSFQALPVHKLLFTKLDETLSHGAILNLMCKYRLPLSYVTTGQNVPDDLEVADIEKLVRVILGGAA